MQLRNSTNETPNRWRQRLKKESTTPNERTEMGREKKAFQAYAFATCVWQAKLKRMEADQRNIGLRELATVIGISPSTLSRVMNAKEPDVTTFFKVCDWLDVSPTKFWK